MGLPLFFEPVGSDLRTESSTKNEASRLPRTDADRTSRSETRDRRNGIRRTAPRIHGPVQRLGHRTLSRSSRERYYPWVPPAREQQTWSRREGMFRDAIREMTRAGDELWRQQAEADRSLNSNNESPDVETGEAARLAAADDMTEDSAPLSDRHASRNRRPRRTTSPTPTSPRDEPITDANFSASLSILPQSTEHSTAAEAAQPPQPPHRSHGTRHTAPGQRAARGLDGLGDRDRSLSPEVWDTLLLTLTPDPQPPSAASSFASASAPQPPDPAWASRRRAHESMDDEPVEVPCESGCDCSDNEADHAQYRPHAPYVPSNTYEPLNSHGPPVNASFARREQTWLAARQSLMQHRGTSGESALDSQGTSNQIRGTATVPQFTFHDLMRGRTSPPNFNSTGSAESRHRHHGDDDDDDEAALEDDWAGMQRIVRSLARREDIPDGWWAEVGLSRMLRQDE